MSAPAEQPLSELGRPISVRPKLSGYAVCSGLVCCVVLGIAACGQSSTTATGPPEVQATHTALSWQHQPPGKPAAEKVAQELLDAAVLPPGSQRLATSPSPLLDQPWTEVAVLNFVGRHAWWKSNLSADGLRAFLKTHIPAGMTLGGTSSATGPNQPPVHSMSFYALGGDGGNPTLQLSIVAAGASTAWLRLDGQTVWYPPRPAGEFAAATGTATISFSGGRTRTMTDAVSVRRLAAEFNALTVQPPYVSAGGTCGGVSQPMLSVAFTKQGAARASLIATTGGCGSGWNVIGLNANLPSLQGSRELLNDALGLLGLPPTALNRSSPVHH